ncbi:MAG: hypothetical protein GY950_28630 [bacterium]|nr:hypothetical protein [bacterium]
MTEKSNKKDSLKELEELLASDVMNAGDDENHLIPKRDKTGIIIRLSVFIIFALVFLVTGIIDNAVVFLTAAAIFIVIEGINVIKIIKAAKKKTPFQR